MIQFQINKMLLIILIKINNKVINNNINNLIKKNQMNQLKKY